jgi:hypothetical protein
MGGACGMSVGRDTDTVHWWLNLKERSDLGDGGVVWSIILKWILKMWSVRVSTGLKWLRIGTNGRLLWMR